MIFLKWSQFLIETKHWVRKSVHLGEHSGPTSFSPVTLRLPFLSVMGAKELRDDEYAFVTSTFQTAAIQKIYNGVTGRQADAARRIHQLYIAHFPELLGGETDEEYHARLKDHKKARRLVAETEAQAQIRREMAYNACSRSIAHLAEWTNQNSQRILGYLKRKSVHNRRNKTILDEEDDARVTSGPAIVTQTNAYREFQRSDHPAKPAMPTGKSPDERFKQYNSILKAAFDELPSADAQHFKVQASVKNAQLLEPQRSEVRRTRCVPYASSGIVNLHHLELRKRCPDP